MTLHKAPAFSVVYGISSNWHGLGVYAAWRGTHILEKPARRHNYNYTQMKSVRQITVSIQATQSQPLMAYHHQHSSVFNHHPRSCQYITNHLQNTDIDKFHKNRNSGEVGHLIMTRNAFTIVSTEHTLAAC